MKLRRSNAISPFLRSRTEGFCPRTVLVLAASLVLAIAAMPHRGMADPITVGAGTLDPNFGNGGVVLTPIGFEATAGASTIQPDGKIIVAGQGSVTVPRNISSIPALVRYKPNGALDTTFGSQGIVLTDLGEDGGLIGAVKLQSDGRIVAVGTVDDFSGHEKAVLMRFNANGTFDTTFGNTGIVFSLFGQFDQAAGLVIQPDGKILISGTSTIETPQFSSKVFVARFNADGSPDISFATNGHFVSDLGFLAIGSGIVLQKDGKILIPGDFLRGNPMTSPPGSLLRLAQDGSIDTSFGLQGIAPQKINDGFFFSEASSALVQPNGKVVAGGFTSIGPPASAVFAFAVVRYNADGSVDSSFGNGGGVATDFGVPPQFVNALGLQADGKIVAIGTGGTYPNTRPICLARYNSNGSADASFGMGGRVTTLIGTSDVIGSVNIQSDGSIVAAGYVTNQTFPGGAILVLRYNGATLDKCLRDNASAETVQFSSTTGNYVFSSGCGQGSLTLSGKGNLQSVNGVLLLTDSAPDRRVSIGYLSNQQTGRATIVFSPAQGVYQTFSVNDTNPHAICPCQN